MLGPIQRLAFFELPEISFTKTNEYSSKSKTQDSLSSSIKEEGGCAKVFLWPFRTIGSLFSWLFSKICCCCSKDVERARNEVLKSLQPELKKLQDFYEKASNRSSAKFKREWKEKFDKLPKELQKMILEQGALSSYKPDDLSGKEWLAKHFEEDYRDNMYDYIVKFLSHKEVEEIEGKKKTVIKDPANNNDVLDYLNGVGKILKDEAESLEKKKS